MSAITELLTRHYGSMRAARLAVLQHLPVGCSNRSRMAQRIDSTLAGGNYPVVLSAISDLVGKAELQQALDLDAQHHQDAKDSWAINHFSPEIRAMVEHGLDFRPPSCISFDRILKLLLTPEQEAALASQDWESVVQVARQSIATDQAAIPATRCRLFGSTTGYALRCSVCTSLYFSSVGEVVGGASDVGAHRLGLGLEELGLIEMMRAITPNS
jgi:hypothetical protein